MTQDPLSPQLLPPDTANADLVLAIADGTARNPLARQRRHPVRSAIQRVRALLWHRVGLVFLALFAVLATGFALLATAAGFSLWNAETALLARSLAEDIRIVLRLGDEDLAGRVQRSVGNTISRSVPYEIGRAHV